MIIWEQRRDKGYISRFGGMVVKGDEKISLTCISANSKEDEKGAKQAQQEETHRGIEHTQQRKNRKGELRRRKKNILQLLNNKNQSLQILWLGSVY